MNYKIALKKPETRTTWDLMQVFFESVKAGSYKKAADNLFLSSQEVCLAFQELESRLGQKIIQHLPKNHMEMERYSSPLMTSEGAKWWLVMSELKNTVNIDERLSYFKRESMMPFGFEPIAYNIWNMAQEKQLQTNDNSPTFCMIKLLLKENNIMKEFKILTTDSFANYLIDPILPKLLFKYPDTMFSVIDATIDREPESDLYLLAYEHPFDRFLSEVLTKGKLCLYANTHYLEQKGVPKTMDDLLHHNILRPNRSNVLLKFGVEKFHERTPYAPIYYKKQALEVDTLTSLITLGEKGAGIICYADTLEKYHKVDMEKLPELGKEDNYVDYTLGFHEKHKNSPIVEDLRRELKSALLS